MGSLQLKVRNKEAFEVVVDLNKFNHSATLPSVSKVTSPMLVPLHHYIVPDSSDRLDQRTRPKYISLYALAGT